MFEPPQLLPPSNQPINDRDGGALLPPARADSGVTNGTVIGGRWCLTQRIGRGAFGDIFLADALEPDENELNQDGSHSQSSLQSHGHEGKRYAVKLEKLPPPLPPADSNNPDEDQEQRNQAEAAAAARAVLKLEAVILSKLQKYPFVGRFIEYGRDLDLGVAYLIMSLLGENLLRLRRRRKDGKFSLPTILRFGIQAIRCIQAVHEIGFLHRDIKPSNFVIGSNRNTIHGNMNSNPSSPDHHSSSQAPHTLTDEEAFFSPSKIFIIDFGLARAYRDRSTGQVLPSRGHIKGFRGTPRYASIHVHREEDLGRRDDLWSLFYILVEFATGDLPWGSKRDKDEIGKIKEQYMSLKLLRTGNPGEVPSCFIPFMKHLYSLKFESKPNYVYLIELLQHKLKKLGYGYCEGDGAPGAQGEDAPFDWEDCSTVSTLDASILAPTRTPVHELSSKSVPPTSQHQHRRMESGEPIMAGGLVQPQPQPSPQPQMTPPLQNSSPFPAVPPHRPLAQPSPSPISSLLQLQQPSPVPSPSESPPLTTTTNEAGVASFSNAAPTQTPMPQPMYPSETTVAAGAAIAPTSAPPASPTPFGLPLSQPIPVPDSVILSPRKSRRSSGVDLAEALAHATSTTASSAAASTVNSTAAPSSDAPSTKRASTSSTKSSIGPAVLPGAALLKPPRHNAAPMVKISLLSNSGATDSVATTIHAAKHPPKLVPVNTPSPTPSSLDGGELEDLRADLNKQRTMQLPGVSPTSTEPPAQSFPESITTHATTTTSLPPSQVAHSGAFTSRLVHQESLPEPVPDVVTDEEDDDEDEDHAGRGDGRTIAPFQHHQPQHSLNDAYILSQGMPDASLAAAGGEMMMHEFLGGDGVSLLHIRSDSNAALQLPEGSPSITKRMPSLSQWPSDSPMATPQRPSAKEAKLIGSMLLVDDDDDEDSSSEESSSSSTMSPPPIHSTQPQSRASSTSVSSPPQARLASFSSTPPASKSATTNLTGFNILTMDQPASRSNLNLPPSSSTTTNTPTAIPYASAAIEAETVAPPSAANPPLASSSSTTAIPTATPPRPTFRPAPPTGLPPPAYSAVQRSFGRFKGARAERSPAKPLSKEQVEALALQLAEPTTTINNA